MKKSELRQLIKEEIEVSQKPSFSGLDKSVGKIIFKVENLGLNKFGVQELNNFYKENIRKGFVETFKVGDIEVGKSKIFKQPGPFLRLKEDNYFGNIDATQSIEGSKYGGPKFSLQLKHINYKITKIEIIEDQTPFSF
jgi:hypothetical protein